MRTFLTISGVVIGIGAIVFLVSLAFGLEKLVIQKTTTLEALTIIDVSPGNTPETKLSKENLKKLEEIPEIKTISPKIELGDCKASFNQLQTNCLIYAINPQYFSLEGLDVEVGKEFNSEDEPKAIISRKTIKLFDLKEGENILGKEIDFEINFSTKLKDEKETQSQKLQIIGITKQEKSVAYIPLKTIQKKLEELDIKNYDQVKVQVISKGKLSEVQSKIEQMGFKASSIKTSQIDEINKIFVIVKIILACFGIIALFVASIGIFNTMTISFLERTHEIGIMKALGATNKSIKRLFNYESAIIGLVGGVIGVAVGYLSGLGINSLINFLAKTFEGEAQAIFYTPFYFAIGTILFSVIVSYIAGIYPARRASRLNPLEALRYE